MTSEREDPPDVQGSSPDLRDAMRALSEQRPGPDRLAEVARKLGSVLDAELPAPAPLPMRVALKRAAFRTVELAMNVWSGRSSLVWLGVALVALSAPLVWLQMSGRPQQTRDPETAHAAPVSADPPVPGGQRSEDEPAANTTASDKEQAAQARNTTARMSASGSTPEATRSLHEDRRRLEHHAQDGHPSSARRKLAEPKTQVLAAESADSVDRPSMPAASDSALSASQNAKLQGPEPARALGDTPAAPDAAVATGAVARGRSETDLIYEARSDLTRDPRAALRLLDEHAARFPGGLLAPEREVLAIDALRALGRTDAAAKRLAAFRTLYPGSAHLRHLQNGR